MKTFTLSLLLAFISIGLLAQIARQKVLVEIITGVECPYCVASTNGLHDLYDNGDPVAGIEYHSYGNYTDPFTTLEAKWRTYYYYWDFPSYPTACFDGSDKEVGGAEEGSKYDLYLPKVNARMDIPSQFEIDIFGVAEGSDYEVSVHMKKISAYPDDANLKLYFALTETGIPYNWEGLTTVDYCERMMIPETEGTPIVFANIGDEIEATFQFTFNNTWVDENCELIAWIQNDDWNGYGKEVLHCASVMLLDLVEPNPFPADFYAIHPNMCVSDTVQFYQDCPEEQDAYIWYFEEGTADDIDSPNPKVYYSPYGKYYVSLTVSDGTNNYTKIRPDYITDTGAPEVTFDEEIPPLCNEDWDPYLLTGGLPEGGEYLGPYITEGKFFHPTEAGVGSYEISYVITDEWGCQGMDIQEIQVVSCTDVNELADNVKLGIFPNPNNGEFSLQLNVKQDEIVDVLVLNELGAIVYTKEQISVRDAIKLNINLKEHAAGVYSLVVRSEKGMINKKIVVN